MTSVPATTTVHDEFDRFCEILRVASTSFQTAYRVNHRRDVEVGGTSRLCKRLLTAHMNGNLAAVVVVRVGP